MVNLPRKQLVSFGILCVALAGPLTVRLAVAAPAATAAAATPAAPATPATPAAPATEPDADVRMFDRNYRLGRYDVIEVTVSEHPEYSDTAAVYGDGTVTLKVLGNIPALGLTTDALAQQITDGMKKELRRPMVTVMLKKIYVPPKPPVVEVPKPKITVLGAVAGRGEIELAIPKMLRVILAQVNPLPTADLAHIRVRYPDGKGRECDFSRFGADGFSKDDILIKGGEEIIFVDQPVVIKPEPLRFTVLGAVAKPGTYVVDGGSASILEALDRAGGAKTSAEMERVKVEGPGHANPILVNVDKYISGDLSANYVLKQNDNIVVPDKPWRILVVGEVQHAGYMNIREGETMLEVFLQAGATPNGDESKAELKRRAPDGKADTKKIDIHAIMRDPDKKNIKMAQGDVLYIPHKTIKRGILYYLSTVATPLWLMRSISPTGGF